MPISLGYWLVDAHVGVGVGRRHEYRGLDRLPPMPGPDEDRGLAARGGVGLLRARNHYWRLDDAGWLRRNGEAALELRDEFAAVGISLEVVRADLADLPDTHGLPADLESRFRTNLGRWNVERLHTPLPATPLGFDVTYPFPNFHSAIRQPVLENVSPGYVDDLNEFGLFRTADAARRPAALCNRKDTAWRPFCCVAISVVGGS